MYLAILISEKYLNFIVSKIKLINKLNQSALKTNLKSQVTLSINKSFINLCREQLLFTAAFYKISIFFHGEQSLFNICLI